MAVATTNNEVTNGMTRNNDAGNGRSKKGTGQIDRRTGWLENNNTGKLPFITTKSKNNAEMGLSNRNALSQGSVVKLQTL